MIINITDINDSALLPYNTLSENQLKTINEPKPGLFIAESPNVIQRAIAAGYEPESFLTSEENLDTIPTKYISPDSQVKVFVCKENELKKICGYPMTRGILAALHRKAPKALEEIVTDKKRIVILENVMNPTNVGAIFRSAAALFMDAVLLTKGCADPLYRRSSRVSMGNVFLVPSTFIEDKNTIWPEAGISKLKAMGYKIAAMALSDNCISIDELSEMNIDRLALVMGTEGDGLSPETLQLCDYIVKIPMAWGIDSLNVAAASAVAFYAVSRK